MKEEQPWHRQSTQPACELMTTPREANCPPKTKEASKKSVKPQLMQLDATSDSQRARETQGEEFLDYLQPAKDPSEELRNYLKTGVQRELGSSEQSKTVKSTDSPPITPKVLSGAPQHLLKVPDVSSVRATPSQRPSAQCQDYAGHSPVSPPMSEKQQPLATVHLSETTKCPITKTFQSESSWKPGGEARISLDELSASDHKAPLHSESPPSSTSRYLSSLHTDSVQTGVPFDDSGMEVVNLNEFCSLMEKCDVQSEKDAQQLQDKSMKSDGRRGSFHEEQEDTMVLPKTFDQSKEHEDFSNAAMNSCASEVAQTVQIENPSNQQRPLMDDLTETRGALSCYSTVPYQCLKAECSQATEATGDAKNCTEEPPRNLATKFAGSFNAEPTPTCNSEEIYLSCGTHSSNRVTANKVAVEGDLMAS